MKQEFEITLEGILDKKELRRLKPGDWIIQQQEDDEWGVAKITSEYDSTKDYMQVKRKGLIELPKDWQDVRSPQELISIYAKIEDAQTRVFSTDALKYEKQNNQINISELLTFDERTYRLGMQYK